MRRSFALYRKLDPDRNAGEEKPAQSRHGSVEVLRPTKTFVSSESMAKRLHHLLLTGGIGEWVA